MRRLVSETRLHPAELVLPIFVREGATAPVPIASMPGVVQHSLESLPQAVVGAAAAGIGGVMLFGVPEVRDARGSGATDPDGILNVATRVAVEASAGRLVVQTDLCLDEFTDHGHCGVLDDRRPRRQRRHPRAVPRRWRSRRPRPGPQLLGLSGMMDGQVAAVRDALDDAGHIDTAILAYSAKYASAFYGPFRDAVESTLEGDRRTLPARSRQPPRGVARGDARHRGGRRHRHGEAGRQLPRRARRRRRGIRRPRLGLPGVRRVRDDRGRRRARLDRPQARRRSSRSAASVAPAPTPCSPTGPSSSPTGSARETLA